MDIAALVQSPPEVLRQVIPSFLAKYVLDPEAAERARARVAGALGSLSDDTLRGSMQAFSERTGEPAIHLAHEGTRAVAHAFCDVLLPTTRIEGVPHFHEAARSGPCLIVSNHLSYVDSLAYEAALSRTEAAEYGARILSVAGPKVYADPFRRIAVTALGNIPAPQSVSVASGEAKMPVREVAKLARKSIDFAHAAMKDGRPVLVFAEGRRTRDGRLGPFLGGVGRYLKLEGLKVVPAAIWGPERIWPVEADGLVPGEVDIRFGEAIDAGRDTPRAVLAEVHRAVSEMLPEAMRTAATG